MNLLKKLLNFGMSPTLEENKKVAIQVALFDALASVIVFFFYFIHSKNSALYNLATFHLFAFFLGSIGLYLLWKRCYDSGRILVHFVGLAEIFLSIDGTSIHSGFEFYYIAPLIVPFVTFTTKEVRKSLILSLCGLSVFLFQKYLGIGHFSPIAEIGFDERTLSMGILFTYLIGLFTVSRWQINSAQRKISEQQKALVHISNIAALGVMSSGIAHEINNPLQILITRIGVLKKQLQAHGQIPLKVFEDLVSMEKTIERIAKIIKGLKSLSINPSEDPFIIFCLSETLEDVLNLCHKKLNDSDVQYEVLGEKGHKLRGNTVMFSQIIINLINNSVDAIECLQDKWIKIEIISRQEKILIHFSDSGNGIPEAIAEKIMHPFFSTKLGKGTGLGLSITSSIIEKFGGKFYYSPESQNTLFVIELPRIKKDSTCELKT